MKSRWYLVFFVVNVSVVLRMSAALKVDGFVFVG